MTADAIKLQQHCCISEPSFRADSDRSVSCIPCPFQKKLFYLPSSTTTSSQSRRKQGVYKFLLKERMSLNIRKCVYVKEIILAWYLIILCYWCFTLTQVKSIYFPFLFLQKYTKKIDSLHRLMESNELTLYQASCKDPTSNLQQ